VLLRDIDLLLCKSNNVDDAQTEHHTNLKNNKKLVFNGQQDKVNEK
jgi:hypothetical protein